MSLAIPASFANTDVLSNTDPAVHVRMALPLLVHVEATVRWEPKPFRNHRVVSLTGHVHMSPLRADLIFQRRPFEGVGTTETQLASAPIVGPSFSMLIPWQYLPMPGPEENNVWVLTPDPAGDLPWREHYAGCCEDGVLTFDQHVPVEATLDAALIAEPCQQGRGTQVHLSGELTFARATFMRLMFRDANLPAGPPSELDSDEAIIIAPGSRVPVQRQTVSGLVGPDPRLSMRVVQDCGHVLGHDVLLDQARRAS